MEISLYYSLNYVEKSGDGAWEREWFMIFLPFIKNIIPSTVNESWLNNLYVNKTEEDVRVQRRTGPINLRWVWVLVGFKLLKSHLWTKNLKNFVGFIHFHLGENH